MGRAYSLRLKVNRIRNKRIRGDNLEQCWRRLIKLEKRLDKHQEKADKLAGIFVHPYVPNRLCGSGAANGESNDNWVQGRVYPVKPAQLEIEDIRIELAEIRTLVNEYISQIEERMEEIQCAEESVIAVWDRANTSKADERALSALTAWEVREAMELVRAMGLNADPKSSAETRRLGSDRMKSILGPFPESSVALRNLAVITGYEREEKKQLDHKRVLQHATKELFFSPEKSEVYGLFFAWKKRTNRSLNRKLRAFYKNQDMAGFAMPAAEEA